ncbi:MAG: hypothetical protein JRH11_16470 [Deltaproteobacteria bacterium]|nr:hypothetical protein [Deltaproteobacteria bacterium]
MLGDGVQGRLGDLAAADFTLAELSRHELYVIERQFIVCRRWRTVSMKTA